MEKGQTILAILLLLSVISCFLPWLTAEVVIDGEERSTINYGYEYIIPLGARYTTPVAILNVVGFILSAYSFKAWQRIRMLNVKEKDLERRIQETFKVTRRIRMLNVIAGVLMLIGAIAAFVYTLGAATSEATASFQYSYRYSVSADYGMGLEALFGFLIIIFGARAKPKTA